jgi:hypothetical protein
MAGVHEDSIPDAARFGDMDRFKGDVDGGYSVSSSLEVQGNPSGSAADIKHMPSREADGFALILPPPVA